MIVSKNYKSMDYGRKSSLGKGCLAGKFTQITGTLIKVGFKRPVRVLSDIECGGGTQSIFLEIPMFHFFFKITNLHFT